MRNKDYVWIVEVKTSLGKDFKPGSGTRFGKEEHISRVYLTRNEARGAARYMQENNCYNHPRFPKTVQYRVRKYQKI